MVDLINQGKGSVLKIWHTNSILKLSQIKEECEKAGEDFYNPSEEFRLNIIKHYNGGNNG